MSASPTRPTRSPRLRCFILDLAVRGKLVPQHSNDEPASELLKRIAKEKARLVKAGGDQKTEGTLIAPGRLRVSLCNANSVGRLRHWINFHLDSLSDGDWGLRRRDQSENGGVRLIQLADVGVGVSS